jgi:hypothetical protein
MRSAQPLAMSVPKTILSHLVHGNCRVVYERARVTKEKRRSQTDEEKKKENWVTSIVLFFSVYLLKRTPLIDQIEPCERAISLHLFAARILIYWVQDKQEARHYSAMLCVNRYTLR